jgi:hypothetical protein
MRRSDSQGKETHMLATTRVIPGNLAQLTRVVGGYYVVFPALVNMWDLLIME